MNSSAEQVTYRPTLANLKLQICLYYNAIFSVVYAILVGACAIEKLLYYNKNVSIAVVIIWAVLEPLRLYYGISGNLKESVPSLATYLLVTIFPTTPFILYLAYIQPVLFPIDPIIGSLMVVCLVVQFIMGFNATRKIIRSQTVQFMRSTHMNKI
jgi:hypothetical protein